MTSKTARVYDIINSKAGSNTAISALALLSVTRRSQTDMEDTIR